MKRFVIVRKNHYYGGGPGYSGYLCEIANVKKGHIYDNDTEAYEDVAKLELATSIKFIVEEYYPPNNNFSSSAQQTSTG